MRLVSRERNASLLKKIDDSIAWAHLESLRRPFDGLGIHLRNERWRYEREWERWISAARRLAPPPLIYNRDHDAEERIDRDLLPLDLVYGCLISYLDLFIYLRLKTGEN